MLVCVFFYQVLSHYDEVKKEGARLTLGQGGKARDDAAGAGGGEAEKTKVLESLKVEVKDASEYYTTEEMAKFKKPKKASTNERTKQRQNGRTDGRMLFTVCFCVVFRLDCSRLCVKYEK